MGVIVAVGFIATFLGVCIAVAAYFNGKHIRIGVSEIGRMIDEIEKVIVKEGDLTRGILERMEARAEETRKEIIKIGEERHRELLRLFGKLFETLPT